MAGSQGTKRITWLDGIKGIACILIFTHHFFLAFMNAAYYGAEAVSMLPFKIDERLSYKPYGVIINGNFWVCVFITIAAFLTALQVFRLRGGDWEQKLAGMIIKRYLRLMLPCGAAGLFAYFLNILLTALHLNYINAENRLSVPRLLWHIFVKMWVVRDSEVMGPFWMMCIVFLGTFIAIILALAGLYKKKSAVIVFYIGAALFLWKLDEYYLCVVAGVALAYFTDRYTMPDTGRVRALSVPLLIAGLYLGGFPSYVLPTGVYALPGLLNKVLPGLAIVIYHALGAGLVILGVMMNRKIQGVLSAKPFKKLGEISIGVFVLHGPLLEYLGYFLKDVFLKAAPFPLAIFLTYLVLFVLLIPISWLFCISIESLTQKLVRRI